MRGRKPLWRGRCAMQSECLGAVQPGRRRLAIFFLVGFSSQGHWRLVSAVSLFSGSKPIGGPARSLP